MLYILVCFLPDKSCYASLKTLASSSKSGCLGTKNGSQVAVGSSPTSPAASRRDDEVTATETRKTSWPNVRTETCGQNGAVMARNTSYNY